MYFIKKITVNREKYESSEIIEHTIKTISVALSLLEQSAKNYVKEECGKQIGTDVKIIDIHNFNQINEPIVDSMLVYRLGTDPHRLHIYQRKTKIVPGTIYGQSLIPEFHKIQIFELEEYRKLNLLDSTTLVSSSIPQVEMVAIGPAKVKIPKNMTVSPMSDLIDELKKSLRFQARFIAVNNSVLTEPIEITETVIITELPTIVKLAQIIVDPTVINTDTEIVENIIDAEVIESRDNAKNTDDTENFDDISDAEIAEIMQNILDSEIACNFENTLDNE